MYGLIIIFSGHTYSGVMRIADFPLIFNDKEFPICWEREYIRLLTTFEVAVELGNGELLIPSALHPDKPNLPQTMFPEDLVSLMIIHIKLFVFDVKFWIIISVVVYTT